MVSMLSSYTKAKLNVLEVSGMFERDSQNFIFVKYEPSPEYYEIDHFKKQTTVEVVASDIINNNSIYGMQFSKHIIDFFSNNSDAFSIYNPFSQSLYPVPVSAYYGTQTKYLNEVLLFGKEYHKSNDNLIQLTSFENCKATIYVRVCFRQ